MVWHKIRNILVVGIDVVSVAQSAYNAGYNVYSVDYFGDHDLRQFAKKIYSLTRQRDGTSCGRISRDFLPEDLLKGVRHIVKRNKIDGVLLSSGLDDSFDTIKKISEITQIIGNDLNVIKRVRNKETFFSDVHEIGLNAPETCVTQDLNEALSFGEKIGYPLVVKPAKGFGGSGVRIVNKPVELKRYLTKRIRHGEVVLQKYVKGMHASVSLIANGEDAIALTVNEQLLGLKFLGQHEPFLYCGNIVPLKVDGNITRKCKEAAERLAVEFKLRGSNGVDMVISKDGKPWIIEVNPRFQGSIECVEKVLGVNIVSLHVKSCIDRLLPSIVEEPNSFCTRMILYADRRYRVPNLTGYQFLRDVPYPNVIIERGEPVCSVVCLGSDREESFRKAIERALEIRSLLRPENGKN